MKGGQYKWFSLLPLISEHTRQGMYLQLIIKLVSLSTNVLANTAKLCAEVLILPDYKGVLIPPLAVCLIPFWSVLIHPLSTLLDTTFHTAIL